MDNSNKESFIINYKLLNDFFSEGNNYGIENQESRKNIEDKIKELNLNDQMEFSSIEKARDHLKDIKEKILNNDEKKISEEELKLIEERFDNISQDMIQRQIFEEIKEEEKSKRSNRKILLAILLVLIVGIIITAVIVGSQHSQQNDVENKDVVTPNSNITPVPKTTDTTVNKPLLDPDTKINLNPNNQYGSSQGNIGNLNNNTSVPEVIQHNQALHDNQIRDSANTVVNNANNLTAGCYLDKNGNGIFDAGIDHLLTESQIKNIQTFNPYITQDSSGKWNVFEIGKMNHAGYDFTLSGIQDGRRLNESLSNILIFGEKNDLTGINFNDLIATKGSVSAHMNLSQSNIVNGNIVDNGIQNTPNVAGQQISSFVNNFNDNKYIDQAKLHQQDENRVNLINGNAKSNADTAQNIQNEITKSTTASGYNGNFKDYEDLKKIQIDGIPSSEAPRVKEIIHEREMNVALTETKKSVDGSFNTFSNATKNDINNLREIAVNKTIYPDQRQAYNDLADAKQAVIDISQLIKSGDAKIDPTGTIILQKDDKIFGNNFTMQDMQKILDTKESAIKINYSGYSTSNQNEMNSLNLAAVSNRYNEAIIKSQSSPISHAGLSNQSIIAIKNIYDSIPKISNLSYVESMKNNIDPNALSNYSAWNTNLQGALNNNRILNQEFYLRMRASNTSNGPLLYGLNEYRSPQLLTAA